MTEMLYLGMPLVTLIALLGLAGALRRRPEGKWIGLGAITGAALLGLPFAYYIHQMPGDMAGIGYIMLPLVSTFGAAAGAALAIFVWLILQLRQGVTFGRMACLLLLAGLAISAGRQYWRVREYRKYQSGNVSEEQLGMAGDYALRGKDYFVLASIASNPVTPGATLLAIAKTPDRRLHQPPSEWLTLVAGDDEAVARKLAWNPATPLEALEALAASPEEGVLAAVASNARVPERTLEQILLRNRSLMVRFAAAGNPNVPAARLAELALDPEPAVRDQAKLNPKLRKE